MRAEGCWQTHPLHPEVQATAELSFKEKEPPAIRGTGYVVHALEAALWAFHRSDSFRDGCLLAVNPGEDADTTAAIYGRLAGAFYGEDGIPADRRQKLELRSLIESLAGKLHALAV